MQAIHRGQTNGGGQPKKLLSAHAAYELLVGEIGIDRKELLYELKLWEINAIVRGYRKRARVQWESTRWQTFCILCSLGGKFNNPSELITFPWERDDVELPTEDEADAMLELMKSINRKNDKSEEG